MTSTADTTRHPDVSEISDLTEGLLSPSRGAAIREHLDGCSLCTDVRTALEDIRGLLGTLPGPPRMPSEIAGRIDAALAAEALLNATAPDADAHVSRETSRGRPAPSVPARPAADRPSRLPSAATGPGRPRRIRRRTAFLGTAFGTAVLGLGLFFLQSNDRNDETTADSPADTSVAAGTTRFDGRPVATTVRSLLHRDAGFRASQESGGAPESFSAEARGKSQKSATADELPACVRAGIQRTDPVLAFQRGDYSGTPAYLVVLPDTADSTRVHAYVMDVSCADGESGKAAVLAQLSLPR
ncbi:hypothetical protein ACGFRB_20325 [Streptomyces sp. NPDC048718]|uniref:hypothetical protein n=1 Tax=Streptomyces sp. NPDC048718 TaxID=3365587 RepID=UPI0037154ED5